MMICVNLFKVYFRSIFGLDNNVKYLCDCFKYFEYDFNLVINFYFIEFLLGLEFNVIK